MEGMGFVIFFLVGCFIAYAIYAFTDTAEGKSNEDGEMSSGGGSVIILDEYGKKLQDGRWKEKRRKIKERDRFTCQWCGSHENLQVHHKYYCRYPNGEKVEPWDYPDDALITLCEDCHRWWHEKNRAKVYYRRFPD